jgi:hypothetical protein
MPNKLKSELVAVLQTLKVYHLDGFRGAPFPYRIHVVPDVLLDIELRGRFDSRAIGEALTEGILRGFIAEYPPEPGRTYRLPKIQCETLDGRQLSIDHKGDCCCIKAGPDEWYVNPRHWYGLTPIGFEAFEHKEPIYGSTAYRVFKALYEHHAFDEQNAMTVQSVGYAIGTPMPKREVAEWKKNGYLDTRRGSVGGTWLTPLGRAFAEKHFTT